MKTMTPGPWKYEQSRGKDWFVYGADEKPVYVLNVLATDRPKAEREANARLIAKAPEMAEILREFVCHPQRTFDFVKAERILREAGIEL